MGNTNNKTVEVNTLETFIADSLKPLHNHHWLKALAELQKQGMFCDLTLRSKDGLEFKVHKNVMYSASGFFRALYSSDFRDSSENILQLDVSTGVVLAEVISFVYQGHLKAKKAEEFVGIANVAQYLQIKELTAVCMLRVENLINDSTCLNCWRLAREYLLKRVEEMCTSHMLNFAQRLFQDASFVNDLKVTEMKTLLEDKHLKCDQETVFKAVDSWAKNTTNSTDEYVKLFSEVVDYIQFSSLRRDFLTSNVLENDALMGDKKVRRKFADCMKYKWKESENLLESENPLESENLLESESLVENENRVKSEWESMFENTEITSERKKHFLAISGTDIFIMPTSAGEVEGYCGNCYLLGDFGYTTFGNNYLLACGGMSYFGLPQNTCKIFQPTAKKWLSFKNMRKARSGHRCVYMDGKIYACGGQLREGCVSCSVEILDQNTEKWTIGPNMRNAREFFGLTSLNGSLYAVGGSTKKLSAVSTIEKLDPRASNKWRLCAANMNQITECQCVSIGYDIYCFDKSKNVYIFDTRMDYFRREWKKALLDGEDCKKRFHVCEIDGEIGVFFQANSRLLKYDLKGNLTSRYALTNVQSSNNIGALVAMYY